MGLEIKKFVGIAAVAAGLAAPMTATPASAFGCRHSVCRLGGYAPRIGYVYRHHDYGHRYAYVRRLYGSYDLRVRLGLSRYEIARIFRAGYGGYLGGYYGDRVEIHPHPYGSVLPPVLPQASPLSSLTLDLLH